jgi:pimeloyl-ACP methyl ester carboxylesterase
VREVVADMTELHDVLGAKPAIWVGHDWGSPVVASIAAQHPARCRGAVLISVPYFPRGFALANLIPLVDRALYPANQYPEGQWDYYRFYQSHFGQAASDYEADIPATLASIFKPGSPAAIGRPSPTASVTAYGGRYGAAHRAPPAAPDFSIVSKEDFDAWAAAFRRTGFRTANAWYLNDAANIAYAGEAPEAGRLRQPVLFLNGVWDPICDITKGRLGEPMREACADLTVADIAGGHWLPMERRGEVNRAIEHWLAERLLNMPQTATAEIHHRTVEVNGLKIFYREAGPPHAPVILLLHGWPASSRMFKGLMPRLADRYRLIAPDYPGFGHSECPPRERFAYTFDHLGEVMEGFVQALGIQRFVLYGQDFGGAVGYRLMLKKPHRMTALIAQNNPAYAEGGKGDSGWWGILERYWKEGTFEARERARRYNDPESIKAQYLYGVSDPSLVDPDNWLIDNALMARPGWQAISLDMLYDIRNNRPVFEAAHAYFREQQPPTLIVSGKNDEIFPEENQKLYLGDLPHAELHLVESGHFALEDKAPEIAALIRDFLGRAAPA